MVSPNARILMDTPDALVVLVYYRVYTEDGAVLSMNPVYSNDPYLGRISAESVTPPHTVISVKRCLCNVENIHCNTPTDLFSNISSKAPMDDIDYLPIVATPGPACTPNDPFVLIAMLHHANINPLHTGQIRLSSQDAPSQYEMRFSK
jgi:hypothetical protein